MYPGVADLVIQWLQDLSEDVVVLFDPANRVRDIPSKNVELMLERATWLLCNAREAFELSGCDDAIQAAEVLASSNGRLDVVVRRGI